MAFVVSGIWWLLTLESDWEAARNLFELSMDVILVFGIAVVGLCFLSCLYLVGVFYLIGE